MFVLVDFKVASSIFFKPWLMEGQAALAYLDQWERIRSGKEEFKKPENQFLKLFVANASIAIAPTDTGAAQDHPGYEGATLAIMPVTGPLMKEDFCGGLGTASLRGQLKKINATQSVQSILFIFDTPGGSVDGTELFANEIANSPKDTIGIIYGQCCSGGYWLGSSTKRLLATSQTDIIGSIGTMLQFYDRSGFLEEQGIVLREYFATKSADKNKMMRDARDGNGKLLVKELLDPTNDIFLNTVIQNRGDKLNQDETLTGKIFLTKDAIQYGLIDGIQSLDSIINNQLQKHKPSQIVMSKLTALLAFFGLAATTEKVELKEEQLEKINTALAELEQAKADIQTANEKITGLEAAAKKDQETIIGLQNQLTTLTKERDELKVENERLGNLDAGSFSKTAGQNDTFNDQKVDAMKMDFQVELNNKL